MPFARAVFAEASKKFKVTFSTFFVIFTCARSGHSIFKLGAWELRIMILRVSSCAVALTCNEHY